jgi:hypothetical protein
MPAPERELQRRHPGLAHANRCSRQRGGIEAPTEASQPRKLAAHETVGHRQNVENKRAANGDVYVWLDQRSRPIAVGAGSI